MTIVDTHLHVIDRTRLSYPWLAGVPALDADFPYATYAAEALEVHERSQAMGMLLPIPVAILGRAARATSGPAAAADALDRLPPAVRDPRYLTAPIWWLERAQAALDAQRFEDALADLGEVAAWQRQWPAPAGGWTLWEPLAVEAHVALGETDRALALASVAVQRATAFGADRPMARALRCAALAQADSATAIISARPLRGHGRAARAHPNGSLWMRWMVAANSAWASAERAIWTATSPRLMPLASRSRSPVASSIGKYCPTSQGSGPNRLSSR